MTNTTTADLGMIGVPRHQPGTDNSTRKAVWGGALGTLVEYFDFTAFGYLSTTIALVFYAHGDAVTALLAALATFGAAFLARPLGAIIFGHIGDKWGRKKALSLSLIIMTIATVCIGILPGYEAMGAIAAGALVILRIVQGVSTGGELGAAITFVGEHASPQRRAFLIGFTQVGAILGALLASLTVTGLAAGLSSDDLTAWGWRIPFLLAAPMGVIGIYIRMKLEDSPDYKRVTKDKRVSSLPLGTTLHLHFPALVRTIGLSLVSVASYFIIFVYLAIHMEANLGHSLGIATGSSAVALAAAAVTMPLIAYLTDLLGRRTMYLVLTGSLLVSIWPLITLLGSETIPLVFLAHSLLGVQAGGLMPVLNVTIAELFPTDTRGTGLGLGFNVANVLAGGTAPYIVALLAASFPTVNVPVVYLGSFAVIGIFSALTLKPTRGLSIEEIDQRLAKA